MFKIFGLRVWIGAVAYLTVAVSLGLWGLSAALVQFDINFAVGAALIVSVVQLVIASLLLTPLWRKVWKKFPILNRLVFPDLSGVWDVEVCSNWPRLKKAILDKDIISPEPELEVNSLRAEVEQTWGHIHMRMWNPAATTPIRDSNTLIVEPIRGQRGRWPRLIYVFEQQNDQIADTDEQMFFGSVLLDVNPDGSEMSGCMWSNRSWQQGLNTGAAVRFTRPAEIELG